jgi:hypothetical protein
VSIKTRHFPKVYSVNSVSAIPPFTYGFFDEVSTKTSTFVEERAVMPERLAAHGVRISGLMTDGGSYQRKDLNGRDPASLPATFSEEYWTIVHFRCLRPLIKVAII